MVVTCALMDIRASHAMDRSRRHHTFAVHIHVSPILTRLCWVPSFPLGREGGRGGKESGRIEGRGGAGGVEFLCSHETSAQCCESSFSVRVVQLVDTGCEQEDLECQTATPSCPILGQVVPTRLFATFTRGARKRKC